jgi:integrase/recombinase XerD
MYVSEPIVLSCDIVIKKDGLKYLFMINLSPIKTHEDEIQSFTRAEIKALLNQIDDSRFVGFRDKVIINVLLDTMVRISELLTMRRSNEDLKSGYIKLEPHETKTKRSRSVPISTKTIKLLEEYMSESETSVVNTYLFRMMIEKFLVIHGEEG